MSKIKLAGLDAAFANFGIAIVDYDIATGQLSKPVLILVKTQKTDSKMKVRASSDQLSRGREIFQAVSKSIEGCDFAMAEVPSGSQSATAAKTLGIATGILCCLGVPLIEVNPSEVKMAACGSKHASKEEMRQWGYDKFPEANWIESRGRKTNDNEHLADALAAICAGIETPEFQGILRMHRALRTGRCVA